jgi:hypothetical protein
MSNINETIAHDLAEARAICQEKGVDSPECAVAWDNVEEELAEKAHQRADQPQKTSLEQYCDDNPDAAECRLYED